MQQALKLITDNIPKESNTPFLIAIDGRCAAGKSTLAALLSQRLQCNVFHMDDFFLQPHQRTAERLAEAGGNADKERFEAEVLKPLSRGETVYYRPFNCRTMDFSDTVTVPFKPVAVIEGSYSCHPELWDYYALHVFLSVEREEQLRRIRERNGADFEMFKSKWIPLEERYFEEYRIAEKCELTFDT